MLALIRMAFQGLTTPHRRLAATLTGKILPAINSTTPMNLLLQELLTPVPTMTALMQAQTIIAVRLTCQSISSKLDRWRNRAMLSLKLTRIPLPQLRLPTATLLALIRVQITTAALRVRRSTNFKCNPCKCPLRVDLVTTRRTTQ